MTDFTIRSGSVDVEQIMRQIRARIREKRGVDYTEEEILELASMKLEKFLDPAKVRSDLLDHYRRRSVARPMPPLPPLPSPPPPPQLPNYSFEADTIYVSSRGIVGRLLRLVRRLLNPILKLFFNPNPLVHSLHLQARINEHLINEPLLNHELIEHLTKVYHAQLEWFAERFKLRDELDALNYEVLNNLVVELTRLGIEVKNLKMRVESLSSRIDFDERRARALEGVVQYRPGAVPSAQPQTDAGPFEAEGEAPVRRRRRRGRRRGGSRVPGTTAGTPEPGPAHESSTSEHASGLAPAGPEPPPRPASDPERTNGGGHSEP